MTTRTRTTAAAVLLALLLPGAPAWAVIPSAFGPIQALIVILPQLLLALAAGMLALLKPQTYRLLFAYLWSHKIFSALLLGSVLFLFFGPPWGGTGPAAEERRGDPWPIHRGGPRRTGAVPGARGPQASPVSLWKFAGDQLGPTSAVDSSPALVGNRLYFGLSNQSAFGSSGGVYAVDTDTGALAWRWSGKGELDPPLRPVFASPAVWAEPAAKGEPPTARYLVSGEGYHEDKNCRILCLDLDPVRRSKGREGPKLLWSVQTTSHVESSPAIHEGRVIIGCGDDGVWCIELATGRVLWRIEGCPYYEVAEGPQSAALGALSGKTVVVAGPVTREGLGARGKDDPGVLVISPESMREHSGPPLTAIESGATFRRTVTGKVVKPAQGRLRLEMAFHNPDSESPPAAVNTPSGRRVIFGSGFGGMRVVCADLDSGAVLWTSPTPHPAFGAPTIDGDRILLGVGNGTFLASNPKPAGALICLSLKEGKQLWSAGTGDTIIGAVAVADGRAYACSRDGNVYVVDAVNGAVVAAWPAGSAMVSSPAVTADAVYVSTDAGRILAFDRARGELRWTFPLTPGSALFSSPAVAEGKLFVGTRSRGVHALADRPKDSGVPAAARPWEGPGGDAGRTGTADDLGLPVVGGDESVARWPQTAALGRPVAAPLAACGGRVFVPFDSGLAAVDASSGKIAWEIPVPAKELIARPDVLWVRDGRDAWAAFDPASGKAKASPGPPPEGGLRAHDLAITVSGSTLSCRSAVKGAPLWAADLGAPITGLPTLAGDRVFACTAGTGQAKAHLHARRLSDGGPLWRQDLDDVPLGHPVASTDWAVVPTADERIALFRAVDGKAREPLIVGGKPVSPAFVRDVLVVAGEARIAAHDLSASEWTWNFKDQDHVGAVTGQPVVCGETVWVGTTKRGLVAIGVPPGKDAK